MRITLLIITVLFCLVFGRATAQESWPLYPGKIPNSLNCPDKETEQPGGRNVIINVTKPTLTVFAGPKTSAKQTAVIICPGGGYLNLSIHDGGYDAAKELSGYGMVVFVLKYRLSDSKCNLNNEMVPLQDLQQAIYSVKSMAAKWNIDTARVGVLGFSAGGHLTAMGATHYQKPLIDTKGIGVKPAFTILAYPVISFTDALTSKKSKSRATLLGEHPTAEQIKFFSPEQHVTAATPPSFLIQASDDSTSLVENSIAYYQALHKNNVQTKMIIYQKGGHGFAAYNKAEDDHWLKYAVDWLKLNKFLN